METNHWAPITVIPIIISGLALLVSGLSMWISFLVYRRAIQREKPLLIARLAPIKDQLGWFQMDLRLESRSSHGWRCNAIRFLTWGACGIAWGDAHEEWLHYFANEPDLGWPPPEPLGEHRWGRILGGRPLSWWKKVSWKKEIVECAPVKLSDKSRGIVNTMISEINNGTADATTRRKFKSAMDYILDNGAFPGAMVTMNVPSGLTVLEGNHRMGAFCGAQLMPDAAFGRLQKKRPVLEQEVWVGTHADGEVPLT
jgi:hypothetical protein